MLYADGDALAIRDFAEAKPEGVTAAEIGSFHLRGLRLMRVGWEGADEHGDQSLVALYVSGRRA